MASPKLPRRLWSEDETASAIEMLANGIPTTKAAKALRRTPLALRCQIHAQGATVTAIRRGGAVQTRTAQGVARLFGADCLSVARWIRRGWLAAVRDDLKRRKTRHYHVHDTAIQAMIDNRATWMGWDPARITDPEWREYAQQVRAEAGGHWLTTPEIAASLGYARHTVTEWVLRGRLPATQVGRLFYVWSADLAAFTPPSTDVYQRRSWATRRQQQRQAA